MAQKKSTPAAPPVSAAQETPPAAPRATELFRRAVTEFRGLIDAEAIEAQQPLGPGAVYTTLVTVWLLVYQRLQAGASLTDAVHELLRTPAASLPNNRRVRAGTLSFNTGAYSRARKRLAVSVTDQVAAHIFTSLVRTLPPSLPERRAFLLDGTSLPLAPSSALRAAYPPSCNQHGPAAWPLVLLVVAHEIESGCALLPEIGPQYGPEARSEQQLALALLPRLPAHSIVIADRNFGVFSIAHGARQAGHDALVRLTDVRYHALLKRAMPAVAGAQQVEWPASRQDRRFNPDLPAEASVTVWLHAVPLAHGETLWLLTTWPCSSEEAARLYRRRLDVETDIRDVKVALNTERLPGRSVDMVRKELAASIIAYNLVVQVRRLAAQRAGVPPRRLSFAGVWSAVRVILLSPWSWTAEQWPEQFELVLRAASQHKLPHRPGRSYPRVALTRRNKSTKHPPPPTKPSPFTTK